MKSKRQLSIRELLLITTVVALALGIGVAYRQVASMRAQLEKLEMEQLRSRVQRIEDLGGHVGFSDYGFPDVHAVDACSPYVRDFDALFHEIRALPNPNFVAFHGVPVTNAHLRQFSDTSELYSLSLVATDITDDGLLELAAFPKLDRLHLTATNTTDRGIDYLLRVKTLTYVDLRHSRVTENGARRLRQSMPGIEVMWQPTPTEAHWQALREMVRLGAQITENEGDKVEDISLTIWWDDKWSQFDWRKPESIEGLRIELHRDGSVREWVQGTRDSIAELISSNPPPGR